MMMSRAGVSAPSVHSEVGDIPEDELERVDANIFRPVEVYFHYHYYNFFFNLPLNHKHI